MNKVFTSWLVLGVALGLAAAPAGAAPKPAASTSKARAPQPLPPAVTMDQMDIVARETEYDGQQHTYSMTGNVRIILRDMVVTCQEATVFASPKEDRVERIVFTGQVEARRGTGVFRGDKVTYFVAERRLLAEGGTRTRLMVPASGSAMPAGIR